LYETTKLVADFLVFQAKQESWPQIFLFFEDNKKVGRRFFYFFSETRKLVTGSPHSLKLNRELMREFLELDRA
jgi:hypothetical protein